MAPQSDKTKPEDWVAQMITEMPGNARDYDSRVCANLLCEREVRGAEFVLQVSTGHVRWFCSVQCVVDGQQAYQNRIYASIEKAIS